MRIFLKFLGIGGVATSLQYTLLMLFVELLKITPVHASVIAYLLSAIFSYVANYYLTFKSISSHKASIAKFIFSVGIGLILTGSLMFLFTENMSFFYLLAQIVATLIVLIWNFFSQKVWVFK